MFICYGNVYCCLYKQFHFQAVIIKVLGTWSSRGNIEKYFRYKYSKFNHPIGSLTEYFKLDTEEDAIAVKHDLNSMKPKVLSQVEQDIVEGKPSLIEQTLYTQTMPLLQSHYCELERVFLSRPLSVQVIQAFYQGYSLSQAAEIASVPVKTARKVLAVLQKQ